MGIPPRLKKSGYPAHNLDEMLIEIKNWKITLAILCANVVMMASGYNILIPFLPMYLITELGVPADDASLWTGLVFSVTFLLGGIMAPIWGKMADKHGKKLMALRSSIMLCISYYAMAVVQTPEQLFMARAFQGFAAGLVSVFMAICSASVPKDKLGVSMGIFQSSLTAGTVIGPLVGGALATYVGMRSSFMVSGTLLLILTVVTWLFLPEPPSDPDKGTDKDTEGSILQRKEIREVLFFMFFIWLVVLIVQPIMTLYVDQLSHGEGPVMLMSGAIFSSIGIAGAITAPFWGRLGQRKGFHTTLGIGLVISSLASLSNVLPDTVAGYAAANLLFALLFAGVLPSLSYLIAQHTQPDEQGRAYAYVFSSQQFGSMLGPLIGGAVTTFLPLYSVYYISSTVLMLLGLYTIKKHF